jgi:uncharacterized membrane protein HdeD (DUF308 family)
MAGTAIFHWDFQDLRHRRGSLFAIGCLLLLVGTIGVVYSVAFTLVSVFILAGLLIVGGILEGVYVLRQWHGGHLLFHILDALLSLVVGALLLRSPELGALAITLLLAGYFIVIGMLRIVSALVLRLPSWGWTLASGLINLSLGVIVWGGWPLSGLWVLGLIIGINLMLAGWARVILALALALKADQA